MSVPYEGHFPSIHSGKLGRKWERRARRRSMRHEHYARSPFPPGKGRSIFELRSDRRCVPALFRGSAVAAERPLRQQRAIRQQIEHRFEVSNPLKHTLLTVDDFASDIQQVRETVIAGDFSTETGPDGATYTGINKLQVPHWFDLLSKVIEHAITPRLSFFRMNLAGELPHSWVHSDDICARYAGILYLNLPDQCRGGTAFWRHTGLHIEDMPSVEHMSAGGGNPEWFCTMMNREWRDLTFWQQSGFVGMAFNRFVTYPTSRFHSRYPFEGFGGGPQDGRLVWTCFYDLA